MNRIKMLRKENHIKQTELAKMLNVTQASISLWESNKTNPSEKERLELCKILNCTPDYLMGYSDINLNNTANNNINTKNTVIILGRDNSGRTEFTVSDKELKIIQKLMESMKDVPDDDNF